MAINYTKGVFNDYTVTPRDLTKYTAYRGVTDFSQIGQFNQYETGYQFLSVLSLPPFMVKLGDKNARIKQMNQSFVHMLEYEFRGLDGLPDLTADTLEITDGINTQRLINKVSRETSVTISSNYFEKSGSLITKWSECYLTGIKDPASQAKTYHNLIRDESVNITPGYENEVFTMLYYVTDNTMLRLERAVLLANCQLTKAETSMYNGSRDNIGNKEMTIEWNCFPIMGTQVDKAAKSLLHDITGVSVTTTNNTITYKEDKTGTATLDSVDYKYGIMNEGQPEANVDLVNAMKN